MGHIPPTWHEEIGAAGFSFVDYLKMHARIIMLQPKAGFNRWVKDQYADYIHNDEQKALTQRASDEDLANMSDEELKAYIDEMIEFERRYFQDMWSGFFIHARDSMALLGMVLGAWYDGENAMVFNDLLTGVPKPTFTMMENYELWDLAQEIRRDQALRERFERYEGAAFFHALEDFAAGQSFLARYNVFLEEYGHRGQADRDLYFPRRIEDLGVDYGSLRALLSAGEDADPRAREHETNAKRAVVVAEVTENIRAKPFGGLKVEAFKLVYDYVQQFLVYRDNERHFTDRVTWAGKRGFVELSRRLQDRRLLQSPREYLFLTRDELFELFDGHANPTWTRAKITGRAANFDAFLAREYAPPMFLQAGKVVSFGPQDSDPSNLHGLGTSRGTVTGIARIVGSLTEVGRLREGEILVTNATDPGWTPVFMVICGIVL
jgi:pyruvate,water dikinase